MLKPKELSFSIFFPFLTRFEQNHLIHAISTYFQDSVVLLNTYVVPQSFKLLFNNSKQLTVCFFTFPNQFASYNLFLTFLSQLSSDYVLGEQFLEITNEEQTTQVLLSFFNKPLFGVVYGGYYIATTNLINIVQTLKDQNEFLPDIFKSLSFTIAMAHNELSGLFLSQ